MMTQATILLFLFLAVLFMVCIVAIMVLIRAKCKQKAIEKKLGLDIVQADYLLVYASQSGVTEAYAVQTAKQIEATGRSVVILNIQQLTKEHLCSARQILWMVSTYGEGDFPDSAQSFQNTLLNQDIDLSHQKFAILAFGDRRYQEFCEFGQRIFHWLIKQKAQSWFEIITVDQCSEQDLKNWNTQLEQVIGISLNIQSQTKQWESIVLSARSLLNSGSIGTGLYQIQLKTPPTMQWKSGDILEIQCQNSEEALRQFQSQNSFLMNTDMNLFRYKNLRNTPNYDGNQMLDAWIDQFKSLPIREYSVASIPEMGTLELVVRQEVLKDELGIGSGLLTEHLHIGESLLACIKSNPKFHLMQENRPRILIGNGSGIAGLLSHLHQCEQWNLKQNWLIFGERQKAFDSIYSDQLQQWQRNNILSDLDLVFSRDENTLKYVQDVLYAKQAQLKSWLDNGGVIYVCGSLQGMAKGVEESLYTILGQQYLDQLKLENRYQRDVY